MNTCLNCGKEVKNKYCNVSCQNTHQNSQRVDKRLGEFKSFDVVCAKCGKIHQTTEREKLFPQKEKYYCNRQCANSRIRSTETKNKISIGVINNIKKKGVTIKKETELKKDKICKYCNKIYHSKKSTSICCSIECARRLPRKRKQNNIDKIKIPKNQNSKKSKKILIQKRNDSNNFNKTFIYTLTDPVTNLVRYIGKSDDPVDRLRKHINESKAKRTHKEKWINSLAVNNKYPIVDIIDEVLFREWEFWETYWISQFKSWGFKLVNGTSGGEGSDGFRGRKHSEETKEKLRILGYKSIPPRLMGENNPNCKLTDLQIEEVKQKVSVGIIRKIIAQEYNISIKYIYQIISGRKRKKKE